MHYQKEFKKVKERTLPFRFAGEVANSFQIFVKEKVIETPTNVQLLSIHLQDGSSKNLQSTITERVLIHIRIE